MPTFEVKAPVGANQIWMRQQIREAVAEATRRGKLRPNSVDSITGKNSGNNLGPGTPIIHFDQWERDEIEVKLILKGGGCENTNAQYAAARASCRTWAAPTGRSTACASASCTRSGRRRARAAAPAPSASASAAIATSGYAHAKEQLFRTLDDVNPDPRLAELEASIMATVNKLGIGTMGFGGKVTLIGCKIGALNRLPASFFVSVAYDCWAFRRLGVVLDATTGAINALAVSRSRRTRSFRCSTRPGFPRTGREVVAAARRSPRQQVRSLKVGDVVLLSGRDVHRPRRGALAPDEARAAGRSARRRPLSLRSGRGEGRRAAGA